MPITSLHLTNAWHATSGGIRTFYTALIDAAKNAGRRVVVVVPGPSDEVLDFGSHGRLYMLAAPVAPAFDRRYRLLYPYRYAPFGARQLPAILSRERPDIVEICDKYSLPYLAALLRKRYLPGVARPSVLVGMSCERFDDNMAAYLHRGRLAHAFTRWYIRHVYGPPFDVHVANSEYTASELRDAMPDRAEGFVRVCPMGVDVEGFGPDRYSPDTRKALRDRLGLGPEAVLLFYAGRISPEKNVPLLVDTLKELTRRAPSRAFGLVVAGDGPLAAWMGRQATDERRGRILLRGNLERHALARHYASCDVFVHPNPREPFGIGPLEAMASGVPVVVPDSGGVLTYATSDNSWMAAPTASSFASAILAALGKEPERIAAARRTAVQFAWTHQTARYFALHDELLAGAATRATTIDGRLRDARV